jgi:hypothetical protein
MAVHAVKGVIARVKGKGCRMSLHSAATWVIHIHIHIAHTCNHIHITGPTMTPSEWHGFENLHRYAGTGYMGTGMGQYVAPIWNPHPCNRLGGFCQGLYYDNLVLGKFGLVRFKAFLVKLKTKWFGFCQDFPKLNLNR